LPFGIGEGRASARPYFCQAKARPSRRHPRLMAEHFRSSAKWMPIQGKSEKVYFVCPLTPHRRCAIIGVDFSAAKKQ